MAKPLPLLSRNVIAWLIRKGCFFLALFTSYMPNSVPAQWDKHTSKQIFLKQRPKSGVTNSNVHRSQAGSGNGEADR